MRPSPGGPSQSEPKPEDRLVFGIQGKRKVGLAIPPRTFGRTRKQTGPAGTGWASSSSADQPGRAPRGRPPVAANYQRHRNRQLAPMVPVARNGEKGLSA